MTPNCRAIPHFGLLLLVVTQVLGSIALAERPWADQMEQFEASDRETLPVAGGVVFLGSSSIRLWDLEKWFPDLEGPVLNRGFGGSQIHHSTAELPLLVLKHKPRIIVFYAGDNDINAGKTAEEVDVNFKAFVNQLNAKLPETKIYFIAIKPSLARWNLAPIIQDANQRIRHYCDSDDRLNFIDIWPPMLNEKGTPRAELLREDGLHLTDEGYAIWSDMVMQALQK